MHLHYLSYLHQRLHFGCLPRWMSRRCGNSPVPLLHKCGPISPSALPNRLFKAPMAKLWYCAWVKDRSWQPFIREITWPCYQRKLSVKRRCVRHTGGSHSSLSWHRAIYEGSAGRREVTHREGYVLSCILLCQECCACLHPEKHIQVNGGIQLLEVES